MVTIERQHFDSGKSAFEALNADTVPFGPLAKKKLVQLGTALSTLKPGMRPGGFFKDSGTAVFLMDKLLPPDLSQGGVHTLRYESPRWSAVKINGSDDVCFFVDSKDFDIINADELASTCRRVGLDVRIFAWDYTKSAPRGYNPPPSKAKIIHRGFKRLCKGKLVGFVLGAYNNPFDARKKEERKY